MFQIIIDNILIETVQKSHEVGHALVGEDPCMTQIILFLPDFRTERSLDSILRVSDDLFEVERDSCDANETVVVERDSVRCHRMEGMTTSFPDQSA